MSTATFCADRQNVADSVIRCRALRQTVASDLAVT
jgi:hypothetical protein